MRHTIQQSDSENTLNWKIVQLIWPYLLEYKSRIVIALACLVLSKAASVYGPFLLKYIVDALSLEGGRSRSQPGTGFGPGGFGSGLWVCSFLDDYPRRNSRYSIWPRDRARHAPGGSKGLRSCSQS